MFGQILKEHSFSHTIPLSSQPVDSLSNNQTKVYSLTIPVAKAMPMSQKGHHMKQMIYTSPTVARMEPPPEVIPIARQANIIQKRGIQVSGVGPTMGMVSLERNNRIATTASSGSLLYGIQPIGSDGQAVPEAISPTHALHVLRESE